MAGAEVARWSFTPGVQDAGHRSLRAALRAHGADAVLVLAMRFDGLLSREERAGRSADHRALGILLQRIEIVFPEAIPTLDRPLPLNGSESDTLAFGGWGHAEADGRWTIAREAHLQFQLPPAAERRPRAVRLLMPRSFSADGRSRQVDVVINGMTISRLVVPAPQAATGPGILAGGTYDVALPDHVRAGAVIDVRLRVDAPASPRSIGLSDDGRELGIFLGAVIPVD